ncbi:hypothetical protein BDV93DRAFT_557985 [Ceratobasidium sp. AG-I]|nr:hypothetical protein BDV93DRAFT_557985 [Ceratobasidium sp. AG-I]
MRQTHKRPFDTDLWNNPPLSPTEHLRLLDEFTMEEDQHLTQTAEDLLSEITNPALWATLSQHETSTADNVARSGTPVPTGVTRPSSAPDNPRATKRQATSWPAHEQAEPTQGYDNGYNAWRPYLDLVSGQQLPGGLHDNQLTNPGQQTPAGHQGSQAPDTSELNFLPTRGQPAAASQYPLPPNSLPAPPGYQQNPTSAQPEPSYYQVPIPPPPLLENSSSMQMDHSSYPALDPARSYLDDSYANNPYSQDAGPTNSLSAHTSTDVNSHSHTIFTGASSSNLSYTHTLSTGEDFSQLGTTADAIPVSLGTAYLQADPMVIPPGEMARLLTERRVHRNWTNWEKNLLMQFWLGEATSEAHTLIAMDTLRTPRPDDTLPKEWEDLKVDVFREQRDRSTLARKWWSMIHLFTEIIFRLATPEFDSMAMIFRQAASAIESNTTLSLTLGPRELVAWTTGGEAGWFGMTYKRLRNHSAIDTQLANLNGWPASVRSIPRGASPLLRRLPRQARDSGPSR